MSDKRELQEAQRRARVEDIARDLFNHAWTAFAIKYPDMIGTSVKEETMKWIRDLVRHCLAVARIVDEEFQNPA